MNYQKLVDTAKKDWETKPELALACERLILAISNSQPQALRHMTFSTIRDLINLEIKAQDVVKVTQYVCGDKIQLLDAGFEYITENESFVLDDDNSHFALTKNAIAHPDTGAVIYDVKSNVFMFFNPKKGLENGN